MRASYASDPAHSRGRRTPERECGFRSRFQRDRDRIIHAGAFRRLQHKSQVFVAHEGDNYRTRLTHSIEVAQVARTIAGALGLDPDLTEAVALAHDLGHTPFGHTGEEALAEMMGPYGGFDHNAQAIRVVTCLETHYAEFDGLNLTWETLEGIAKHNGPVRGALPWALQACQKEIDLELDTHAGGEAQAAALSDDIAYTNHDLQDGLRAGLFSDDEIRELPIISDAYAEVDGGYPGLPARRRRHEALRRVFARMMEDATSASMACLRMKRVGNVEEIRALEHPVVIFSGKMVRDMDMLKQFLFARMYRAPSVVAIRVEAARVVKDLFAHWMQRPLDMPVRWHGMLRPVMADQAAIARLVSDYVAGMTDRFALREHARILGKGCRAGMPEQP